jgi:hypothetical protein
MKLQNGQFVMGTLFKFQGKDYAEFWQERILGVYWDGKVYEVTFLKYLHHRKSIPLNRIQKFFAVRSDAIWAAIESGIYEKHTIGDYYPIISTKFPASLIQAEPNENAIFEITHA